MPPPTRSDDSRAPDVDPGASQPAFSRSGEWSSAALAPPQDKPRFVDGGLLGQGGMGRVVSVHDGLLDRAVARKETPVGATPEITERLLREARIAARLEHPSIVPVHDAGKHPDGRPWYTMPVLRGRSLEEAAKGPIDERLRLVRAFHKAAEAVGFAHAQGVVHRDIKPANIVLGEHGEVRVIDWGLARAAGDRDLPGSGESGDASLTRVGDVLGSPSWIAPEAARGEEADPRTDVFGLGATLTFLLDGTSPWPGQSSDDVLAAAFRAHRARIPRPDPAPPELRAIAERAMAADPAERYADGAAFAADLGRWLDGRRVEAHRYSSRELLLRTAAAWRTPLLVAAVALVVLAVLGATSARRIVLERNRALDAERETRSALHAADASLARALLVRAQQQLAAGAWPEASCLARRVLEIDEEPRARGIAALVDAVDIPERSTLHRGADCRSVTVADDGRRFLCRSDRGLELWEMGREAARWQMPGTFTAAQFSRDARRVHALSADPALAEFTVHTLDAATGAAVAAPTRAVATPSLVDAGEIEVLTFAAPAQTLSAWTLSADGRERLGGCEPTATVSGRPAWLAQCTERGWLGPGSPQRPLPRPWGDAKATSWELLPGGAVVVGTQDGRLLRVGTGLDAPDLDVALDVGTVTDLRGGAPGGLVAVEGVDGIVLVEPSTFDAVRAIPRDAGRLAGVSQSGDLFAFDGRDVLAFHWAHPPRPAAHRFGRGLTSVRTDPEGRELLVTGAEGLAVRWDLAARAERGRYVDPVDPTAVVKSAAYDAAGRRFAIARSGAAGLSLHSRDGALARHVPDAAPRLLFAADRLLAPTYGPRMLREREDGSFDDIPTPWTAQDLDGSGRVAVALDQAGGLWDLSDPALAAGRRIGDVADASALAVSDPLVFVAGGGALRALGIADGEPVATWDLAGVTVLDLDVSPDGSLLALAEISGAVQVRDRDGVLLAVVPAHAQRVASVSFGEGAVADRLFSASWDGTFREIALAPIRADRGALAAGASGVDCE